MSSRTSRKRARGQVTPDSTAPPVSTPSSARDPGTDLSNRGMAEEGEGEGEDLMDQTVGDAMRGDYREIAELDRYDEGDFDNRNYAPLSFDARRAAEAAISARERNDQSKRQRLPAALRDEDEEEDDDAAGGLAANAQQRRRRRAAEAVATGEGGVAAAEEEEEEEPLPADALQDIRESIRTEVVRREVRRRFRVFLDTIKDDSGRAVYRQRIKELCAANGSSLSVSYLDLNRVDSIWATWLVDTPEDVLAVLNEGAMSVVLSMFPDYQQIHPEMHVRITDWPLEDSLRELRQVHMNSLVRTHGVVTRRTGVFPQMKLVKWACGRCSYVIGPLQVGGGELPKPTQCPECQATGPFEINNELTVYRNYQKLTVQESPSEVPAGRVPRQKEVILTGDLVDTCRPGEDVVITGVLKHQFDASLNAQQGFPVFTTLIEANNVEKREDVHESHTVTEEDKAAFERMRKDPGLGKKLLRSFAPSIYGYEHVKMAVLLSLFGGHEKNVNGKHRIRGDINVLLLGDPGTAKSQVLKYVIKTAPRAVYTTGKGASAVGLTASVHKDPLTREWTLEGGALVLADRGTCLIDEFDKMNDGDRTSIHEAMEQQSISISKAGIVTTLQARCGVVAAANPIGGRYDPTKTFSENVELTDPILQRFDVLCVSQDAVDPVDDEKLATYVTTTHIAAHPRFRPGDDMVGVPCSFQRDSNDEDEANEGELPTGGGNDGSAGEDGGSGLVGGAQSRGSTTGHPAGSGSGGSLLDRPHVAKLALDAFKAHKGSEADTVSQELLRKYIIYARRTCNPRLTNLNKDKVSKLYAELRQQSMSTGGVPVAVRHVESMMRLSEAHARMHLRTEVLDEDLSVAMKVILESFIAAQKFSVMQRMRRHFRQYLVDPSEHNELLLHVLKQLVQDTLNYVKLSNPAARHTRVDVQVSDFARRAREFDITAIEPFLSSDLFKSHEFELDREAGKITVRL